MPSNDNRKKSLNKNLTLLFEQTESIAKTGSWELDLKTNKLFWSDGVFKILDYPPQSFPVTLERGLEVIHPEDREIALATMNESIQNNKDYKIQKRFITIKGEIKHILSLGKILKDENDNPYKLVGVFQDITEFVNANEELTNLKSLIEVTANSIDGVIWEADAATFAFTYVSNQVEKLLGFTAKEWLEEENFWFNHIHPEDRKTAVNFCHKETLEGRDHTFNYRMLKKDGQYVWVKDRVTVIMEGQKPTFLRGLLVNIDKDKEYLNKIEEEKNLSNNLIQNLPNVVFLFDEKGRLLLWNDKFIELSEYSNEEAKDLSPSHFFDFQQNQFLEKYLQKIDKDGYIEVETEFISKSGKKKPMLFIATKFTYYEKKCIYGVGIDVSQRNILLSEQRKLLNTIENIIQFTPESLLVFNKQFDLLKKNKSFDELIKKYANQLNFKEEELKVEILNQLSKAILKKEKAEIIISKKSKN
jgi:PAS domain S-box-containing protein